MNQCSSNTSSYFPKAKKTGTTIAGIIFKDGVVLGADTRATEVKHSFICFQKNFIFIVQQGMTRNIF